ncbi:hypothetical protein [Haloarcula rubripromontorii]|uniref:Uncharacterized protein n=1 Tax=Haloarcula rubripromontorii TaxID=1705562 RepID=A0A847U2D3_9EURY|nr:hypothetical protein [Haloarcula rubripromontorii]NLV06617.1 hypothetical protein [Haloarcula rubripromontorii]
MLSDGAKELKLTIGVPPDSTSIDGTVQPSNSEINLLDPRSKDFIKGLDENTDEAIIHRRQILREFRSLCQAYNIEEDNISNWQHISDLVDDDRIFIEAMNNYSRWGISQKEQKKPMTAYALGKLQAHIIELMEMNRDGDNLFKKKAESTLENNPEEAKALIAVRCIANGN